MANIIFNFSALEPHVFMINMSNTEHHIQSPLSFPCFAKNIYEKEDFNSIQAIVLAHP